MYYNNLEDQVACENCISDYLVESGIEEHDCPSCGTSVFEDQLNVVKANVSVPRLKFDDDGKAQHVTEVVSYYFCPKCSVKKMICPCGIIKDAKDETFTECVQFNFIMATHGTHDKDAIVKVNSCCLDCKSAPYPDPDTGDLVVDFDPEYFDAFESFHYHNYPGLTSMHQGFSYEQHIKYPDVP
jgi:hypothetical protein